MVVDPKETALGKPSLFGTVYNPSVLCAISRQTQRDTIGIRASSLPFVGFDVWNHYEVSWLNPKGKPIVALAEIIYGSESPNIVESKSMKLYFNTFNNTVFSNSKALSLVIERDLSLCVGAAVSVKIMDLTTLSDLSVLSSMQGCCLDERDVSCSRYTVCADYLVTKSTIVEETVFSNLFKSNCLVTNQPDWASVQIAYRGQQINLDGLLQYLVSFRNHNEFHEQCIERIFMDIMQRCKPRSLQIYGRYTRRGGLDINAYRGTEMIDVSAHNQRLIRQ
jgi:7-cyano-7-deazaguanine reductase